MLRLLFISVLLFFATLSNSQLGHSHILEGDPCSGNLKIKSDWYNRYPYDTYHDFITNYFDEQHEISHITMDRNQLKPIKQVVNLPNTVIFFDKISNEKEIMINIQIGEVKFPIQNLFKGEIIEEYIDVNFSEIYFGNYSKRDNLLVFTQIKSIVVNFEGQKYKIDSTSFSNLVSPNTCYSLGGIQPISAYFNESLNSIYIYVTGMYEMGFENEVFYEGKFNSFLAKIVLDLNTKKQFQMVVPGTLLRTYGWHYCPTFWAF